MQIISRSASKTGTAVATASIIKSSTFKPKTRPLIVTLGSHKGLLTDVVYESGTEADVEISRLIATTEISDKGHLFKVSKAYNMLPGGRGISAFMKDYELWTGVELSEDDLYNDFNCESIKGRTVNVRIEHRKDGKLWEAYIKDFLPFDQNDADAPVATEAVAA